jgi:hypothetical protein
LQSRPWSGEDGDDVVVEGVPGSVMGTAHSATTVDGKAEAPVLAVVTRRRVVERVRDDAVHSTTQTLRAWCSTEARRWRWRLEYLRQSPMVARRLDEASTPGRITVVVPLLHRGGAEAGTVSAFEHHSHSDFGLEGGREGEEVCGGGWEWVSVTRRRGPRVFIARRLGFRGG